MSEPFTDDELTKLSARYDPLGWRQHASERWADADVCRLVAEVSRLRSDEWLEKAAREMATWRMSGEEHMIGVAVGILRKHRDGL